MQKIPTAFLRDENDRKYVTDVPNPDCAWVFEGHGTATRKYDGTCVMLDEHGDWWARREVKPGKSAPANFVAVSTDDVTQKTIGWEPVGQSAFAKWHAEALAGPGGAADRPGTYELVGPKVNGNPERVGYHILRYHKYAERMPAVALSYDNLRRALLAWNEGSGIEGVVWHHPDGRMAKLKARDFRRDE
jgi:Family of unknown function (DUF5565)